MANRALVLSWIPLFLHRLKASDAWRDLQDFQFGWYMKLIVESCLSEKPGYLPNDDSVLWQLAGARTKAYFQREGQSVLRRFHGHTEDMRWIYHPVVLDVLEAQMSKMCKKESSRTSSSPLSFSVVDVDVVFEVVQRLFEYYKQKLQRASTYTLTESRKKKCAARLSEVMRSEGCDLSMAEQIARKAIDNLAASQWHRDHGFVDWNDQIFRSQEEFQKRVEFKPSDDFYRPTKIQLEAAVGTRRMEPSEPAEMSDDAKQFWATHCRECAHRLEACVCKKQEAGAAQ